MPPFLSSQASGRIAGYYTLASASVYRGDLPARYKKKLPRHPAIPVVRMGRLAVDRAFKSQGLGGALLADALTRVIRSEIAAYTSVVDAKDNTPVSSSDSAVQACCRLLVFYEDELARIKTEASSLFD